MGEPNLTGEDLRNESKTIYQVDCSRRTVERIIKKLEIGKRGGPRLFVLNVSSYEQAHPEFFGPRDEIQGPYEWARRAVVDRRIRLPVEVQRTLQAHSFAGLFLDPVRTLVTASPSTRPGLRTHTAFHHTHLQETLFETIGRSEQGHPNG
jgi:hypothetical protein